MSRRHLRHDTTCQNCGDTVQKRFCSNCGQENTETRQSFGHLLRHFMEDLTHYDGAFWLTMRYLLFRPAYLTKEFLRGRRSSFVPPVRLYIFISFITFLLPFVLPDFSETEEDKAHEKLYGQLDSASSSGARFSIVVDSGIVKIPRIYKSIAQLDSAQAKLPESKRLGTIGRALTEKFIAMQKYDNYELGERFFDAFDHSFPKAMFIYLPLFAFTLWLFHGKKRWMYFDHAIFTLHYFSFVLLVFNLITITSCFFFFDPDTIINFQQIEFGLMVIAMFVYFFVAHRRMYEESRLMSFVKSIFIYTINLAILVAVMWVLGVISLFTIH